MFKPGCKVRLCTESHYNHYCRFCGNPDSTHLASQCRFQKTRQPHKQAPQNHDARIDHRIQGINHKNFQQAQNYQVPYNHDAKIDHRIQGINHKNFQQAQKFQVPQNHDAKFDHRIQGINHEHFQQARNSQSMQTLPEEELHRIPVEIQDLLIGIISNEKLTPHLVEEMIEQICLLRQNKGGQMQSKFGNLKIAFDQLPKEGNLIKAIQMAAQLSLKMMTLFQNGVPLLESKQNKIVSLSPEQCACLVSNMFFCTLHTNSHNFPKFSMENIFRVEMNYEYNQVKVEKIKCLLNYFSCIERQGFSQSQVTIKRSYLQQQNIVESFQIKNPHQTEFIPKEIWEDCQQDLCHLSIKRNGKIEDEQDAILVDFANMFVGGGVLNHGCVQEEILFLIYPQLFASMLITQKLGRNEALFVSGVRRYNQYQGYSNTFKFNGTSKDNIERDFICIDAHDYNGPHSYIQYSENEIIWELTKAFIGFQNGKNRKLSTGRWGCGAFKGDWQLKFFIQWLAASVNNYKTMVFYNVMNQQSEQQQIQLDAAITHVLDKTVGQLYDLIQYWALLKFNSKIPDQMDLLTFLITKK